jgi:glycosyltransferase involved in cell wall biosynthesis
MKILLIGKYPPLQGGISSKTYWLYRYLEKKGFEFRIVTVAADAYTINKYHNDPNVTVVNEKKSPWHIPETDLLDDRLINEAKKIALDFCPDLIETNYLWPFCKDALLISKILKKPLLIRHAGSDIIKFSKDKEYLEIMESYFSHASAIATNSTSVKLVNKLCGFDSKTFLMQRYIPDPSIFKHIESEKPFHILFTGKINYHWQHKGLLLLLEIIKEHKLKALFVIGGLYKNKLLEEISFNGIDELIHISEFVPPENMPLIYNSCKFVWAWEEEGNVEDFPNIIWESLYSGTSCIVNSAFAAKLRNEKIPECFSSLIRNFDAHNIMGFEFTIQKKDVECNHIKDDLFNKYVYDNINLYTNIT